MSNLPVPEYFYDKQGSAFWCNFSYFGTYRHTSPSNGTYYGRSHSKDFDFSQDGFNKSRWLDGTGYGSNTVFGKALQKYPDWNSWKHEICRTHLMDWECSFIECCGVLESMSTGHSYNNQIPTVGGGHVLTTNARNRISSALKNYYSRSESIDYNKSRQKEAYSNPKLRKLQSDLAKQRYANTELKEKLSVIQKKRFSDDSERTKTSIAIIEAYKDPVKKQHLVDSIHKRYSDPEYLAFHKMRCNDPEHIKNLSDSNTFVYELSDGHIGTCTELAHIFNVSVETMKTFLKPSGGFSKRYNITVLSRKRGLN